MKAFAFSIFLLITSAACAGGDGGQSTPGDGRADNPLLQQWLSSVRKWEDLPHASLLLSGGSQVRHAAMVVMLRLWDETHALPAKGIPGLDEVLKGELIGNLAEVYPKLNPAGRGSALEFGNALGLNRPE